MEKAHRAEVRKIGRASLAALALGIALAGCTAIHPPPPYLPSRSAITPGPTVKVRGNQNVYAIARENNVSMRDIIVLNDLRAPFALKTGQSLVLPAGAGAGSSPYSDPGAAIGVGYDASAVVAMSPRAATAASSGTGFGAPSVEQAELPPLIVPKAETSAPSQHDASATANTLRLPSAPQRAAPGASFVMPSKPQAGGMPDLTAPQTATNPLSNPVATTGVFAPTVAAESYQPEASDLENSGIDLVWPVQGPILSSYGPKGQGLSNDGMNISAPKGAPVVAAASGIVVYSGNEIKGFGNLVLIRHQGGIVTAYAHLDRSMVNKDTVVAQGDMIGTVGKTGNVASPQLHFEVRKSNKPVNPEDYLKSSLPEKQSQG